MLKKFKASLSGIIGLVVVDIVAILVYLLLLYISNNKDIQLSNGCENLINIFSNLFLVAISIMTTSIISVPLIEVRGKNTLCTQMLASDVLRTPQFLNALEQHQKEDLLKSLEANLHFDCNSIKESMFYSVRDKLKNVSDFGYFFESCEYDIKCEIKGSFIIKTIMKSIDLRAYEKKKLLDFPLCATSFASVDESPHLTVSRLSVNGNAKDLLTSVKTVTKDQATALEAKSGYINEALHSYTGTLMAYPDKPTRIEMEYTTTVPLNDTSFSCRLTCPCHKFSFRFHLIGQNANDYNLSPRAFGFIDDGASTPNHHNDDPVVVISLNDWMFPYDGVSVNLMPKQISPLTNETSCDSMYALH